MGAVVAVEAITGAEAVEETAGSAVFSAEGDGVMGAFGWEV